MAALCGGGSALVVNDILSWIQRRLPILSAGPVFASSRGTVDYEVATVSRAQCGCVAGVMGQVSNGRVRG